MPLRTRALILFALAAPAVALGAAALRPRPRSAIRLPDPPVTLVEEPAAHPPIARPFATPAPILPPDTDAVDPVMVSGQVVDAAGHAVPWTRLTVRNLDGIAVGVGKADENGRFAIPVQTAGVVLLLAQLDDRRGLAGPFDPDEQPMRVVVASPGRVRGVLVDMRGVPVPDAAVTASRADGRYDDLPDIEGFRSPSATTDSEGRFTLAIPTPGAWTLSSDGAQLEALQVLGGDRDVILTLGAKPTPPLSNETADPDTEVAGGNFLPRLALHDTDDGRLVVVGSPADANLMPGDVIIGIDGHSARGEAWEHLMGPEGSTVDLEIERPATHLRFRARLPRLQVMDDDGC